MVKFGSQEDAEDNYEYDEEDFEDPDDHTHGAHGPGRKSPESLKASELSPSKKRVQTPGKSISGTQSSDNKEKSPMGGMLDDYLKGIESDDEDKSHGTGKGSASGDFAKAMQPLEGIKPTGGDAEQRAMMRRLGYSQGSDESPSHPPPARVPVKTRTQKDPVVYEPTAIDEVVAATSSLLSGDEGQQARNVENFLMDLFPERYDKKKGGGKKKAGDSKAVKHTQGPAPSSHLRHYDVPDDDYDAPKVGGDLLGNLDSQLKLLRKEIKVKDDKIVRLKEHSDLMAAHMERLKGEVARLNAKLHGAEMELESKESRLQDALRARKKAAKKAKDGVGGTDGSVSTSSLEADNQRLREREQALMDAIEELSVQNEDLIIKLRESMQRELDLSTKRAALVSHSLMPKADSMLPSIYKDDHHNVVRSQSEPSDLPPRGARGGGQKKKKKGV